MRAVPSCVAALVAALAVVSPSPAGISSKLVAYENFRYDVPATVSVIEWQGFFFGLGPGAVTLFAVHFYADLDPDPRVLAGPGALLLAQNVGPAAILPLPDLSYRITLRTPFHAEPGHPYWLAVANAGPGAVVPFPGDIDWSDRDAFKNADFILSPGADAAAPAPGTLGLLAVAAACVAVRRRCRRGRIAA